MSFFVQSDPSSVRILKSCAKVSPQHTARTLVSDPKIKARSVFGVSLQTLRDEGQMVCGIPLVLRDIVDYLDTNGNLLFWDSSANLSFIYILHTSYPPSFTSLLPLTLTVQNNTQASPVTTCSLITGLHHRGLFRLCGSVVRTRQLRQRWDNGERVNLEHEGDVPTVASLLKLFFRELPNAIVPEPHRKELVLSLTGTRKSCLTGFAGNQIQLAFLL